MKNNYILLVIACDSSMFSVWGSKVQGQGLRLRACVWGLGLLICLCGFRGSLVWHTWRFMGSYKWSYKSPNIN